MIGYIYLCTCLCNDKHYIGQTIRDCDIRWKEHQRHSKLKKYALYNCKFYRALRKYGCCSFKLEILETINLGTRKELQKQLDILEVEYIKKYDSYKNGYNSTIGGEHSFIEPKSVIVFSDIGVLLEVFDTALEASKFYDINISTIRTCCGRFSSYVRWKNKRLIFRWSDDTITKEDLSLLEKCHRDFPVEQYNLNGDLIESFTNISLAAKKLNLKNSRIIACCNKRTSFVQIGSERFVFRYKGDVITEYESAKAKRIKSNPKVAVTAIDSVTKKVIGDYISQCAASRALNINPHNISEAIRGNRKTAGKYNGHPVVWIKNNYNYETC